MQPASLAPSLVLVWIVWRLDGLLIAAPRLRDCFIVAKELDEISAPERGAEATTRTSTGTTTGTTTLPGGALSVRQLSFRYAPARPLLEQISLDIPIAARIGIKGRGGAGKSTLLRLLSGQLFPSSGSVTGTGLIALLDGALVLQATVRENLTLWQENFTDREVVGALDLSGVWPTIRQRGGIDTHCEAEGKNFSGGERIRLTLARLLLHKPAVLLIDEAFDSLEAELETRILDNLRREGIAVVIVSHRKETLDSCDLIYTLNGSLQTGEQSQNEQSPYPSADRGQAAFPPPVHIRHPESTVVSQLRHICARVSSCVPIHEADGQRSPGAAYGDPVRIAAATEGLWLRPVRLRGAWWRNDHGPLIAQRNDGTWVALLRESGSYVMYENDSEPPQHLASDMNLVRDAFMPYRSARNPPSRLPLIIREALRAARLDFSIAMAISVVGILAFATMILALASQSLIAPVALVVWGVAMWVARVAWLRLEGYAFVYLPPRFWAHILSLPVRYIRNQGIDRIVSWCGDLPDVLAAALRCAQLPVLTAGWLTAAVLVTILAPDFSPVVVGTFAVTLFFRVCLSYAAVRKEAVRYQQRVELNLLLETIVNGMSQLRCLGTAEPLMQRWQDVTKTLNDEHAWVRHAQSLADISDRFVSVVLVAMLLLLSSATAPGELLAPAAAILWLAAQNNSLADSFDCIWEGNPGIRRLRPMLEITKTVETTNAVEPPIWGSIELRNVWFRYPDFERSVLKDVSLTIPAGKIVALVGPSGRGKTTLLRILSGLEHPDQGEIIIGGCTLVADELEALRTTMGAVLQHEWLSTATVRSHIAGNLPFSLDEIWTVAEATGIAGQIRSWPMGLQSLVDSVKLTQEEVQQILLARALI
ncbi:MAG: ATP-binding cassette domain-containing protein, partial [Chloroflexi bacterium]|nr:ATP-binding cassette domain-containing protein [Chloroflexota bacterium]